MRPNRRPTRPGAEADRRRTYKPTWSRRESITNMRSKSRPPTEQPYLGLADLYMKEKKLDLAAKTLRAGLEKAGNDSIELNSHLAEVLLAQGRLDEAEKTIAGLEHTAERIAPISAAVRQGGIEANDRFAAGPMVGVKGALSRGRERAAARGGGTTDYRPRDHPQHTGVAMAGRSIRRVRPVGSGSHGLRAGGRAGAEGR